MPKEKITFDVEALNFALEVTKIEYDDEKRYVERVSVLGVAIIAAIAALIKFNDNNPALFIYIFSLILIMGLVLYKTIQDYVNYREELWRKIKYHYKEYKKFQKK